MEIIDPNQKREFEHRSGQHPMSGTSESKGRVLAGLFIIFIGGLILAQKMGAYFPDWLFSWQMLLIAIGIFVGAKQNFQLGGWLIPIFIGILFLFDRFLPEINVRPYYLPIILIIVGAVMMLSPNRRRFRRNRMFDTSTTGTTDADKEDMIDSVSIFGGMKRNVISKSFKGGECVTVFGGSEINLMQSDIQGTVKLELVQIFGGTKLIIPSNWKVQSDLVSIFGDIQDTRLSTKESLESNKVLFIDGVSILGGISIKSY